MTTAAGAALCPTMQISRRRFAAWLSLGWFFATGAAAEVIGPIKADRIVIVKAERRLYLMLRQKVIRTYPIRLGPNPVGPKIFERDGRTPEGQYVIDERKPDSEYFRSLRISYPNAENLARAAKHGTPAGDNIRIHGTPRESGHFLGDWTDGCIAVSNEAMQEIWDAVDLGTPVEIRP